MELFRTIKATYYRTALDFVEAFAKDANINGMKLDTHKEETTVELFAENLMKAGQHFLENPMDAPFIPSWNRVLSAMPNVNQELADAVHADMKAHGKPLSSTEKTQLQVA
jgi:glucosyl-3-phosphoglycerate synthase